MNKYRDALRDLVKRNEYGAIEAQEILSICDTWETEEQEIKSAIERNEAITRSPEDVRKEEETSFQLELRDYANEIRKAQ